MVVRLWRRANRDKWGTKNLLTDLDELAGRMRVEVQEVGPRKGVGTTPFSGCLHAPMPQASCPVSRGDVGTPSGSSAKSGLLAGLKYHLFSLNTKPLMALLKTKQLK